MPQVGAASFTTIYSFIFVGFLSNQKSGLPATVQELAYLLVSAIVELYHNACSTFFPTPSKSHYKFNLRDASSLVSGILHASSGCYQVASTVAKLWTHEGCRVFRDRLIDYADRNAFDQVLSDAQRDFFIYPKEPLPKPFDFEEKPNQLVFTDFPDRAAQPQIYKKFKMSDELLRFLIDHLDDYNLASQKPMHLIPFDDAILHLTRIARFGRQFLIRLAARIANCKLQTFEVIKNYGQMVFREDLKKSLSVAGEKKQQYVSYVSDNHIVQETFLVDINNLMNVGDIPNIWKSEEADAIVDSRSNSSKETGRGVGRDDVMAYFNTLVRSNLHVVLCMSPSGKSFRTRLHQFPSLVNYSTLDWHDSWPSHALLQVAHRLINNWNIPAEYKDRMDEKLNNGFSTQERKNKEDEAMKTQFIAIQPRLEVSQKDTIGIMAELTVQQKEVEGKEEVVCREEAIVTLYANQAEALAEVNHEHGNKLKMLMNAEFIGKFSDYDKDILDEKMMVKLRATYIISHKFQHDVVENVSKAAKSQYSYIHVAKEVQPKRAKVKESMEKLELMQQALAVKKFMLHRVEDKNAYIKSKCDASVSKKAKIEAVIEVTRVKLIRVEKLLN
ncbi:MAG: putative dynein heavy chain [Streblomastix strix]|uniref:Putative dynein heavy chain n=1 Tax=Streblomastix strix TaxID=222440 RepID=A0A5J4WHE3_9EUKA|nr:MAG: putative dynein heavy chain [Streblomastix strix]